MTDARVISEPFIYRQDGEHSYYADIAFSHRIAGASDRLQRHGAQMDEIAIKRSTAAERQMRAAGIEYRVEPNTNQGTGGYFTPPAWLNDMFATARRPGRVLAALAPKFELPLGVSSINIPIINSGTTVGPVLDGTPSDESDITDSAGSSTVVTLSGYEPVSFQLLEQSPVSAAIDAVVFMDLTEAYDYAFESQLLYGTGTASGQLPGVVPNATTAVTFTNASPTGSLMWPFLSQAAAQIGDARDLPPEAWLMRTARWAWLQGSESTAGYPFGVSPYFIGKDDSSTPDPIGGLMGWPVFLDDAVSPTQGATLNQDQIICIRPSDLVLFEGTLQTSVNLEPGSGALSANLVLHSYVAAITRYTSGIATVGGTGFVVASGY